MENPPDAREKDHLWGEDHMERSAELAEDDQPKPTKNSWNHNILLHREEKIHNPHAVNKNWGQGTGPEKKHKTKKIQMRMTSCSKGRPKAFTPLTP